jgi:hypothetical protein
MAQEPFPIPPRGNQIVRAIGTVSLWLAAIGFLALALKIWGFHQAQVLSILPSDLPPGVRTAFRSEWIASGTLFLAQAYVGWRLRRGTRGIEAGIVLFCGLTLYFLVVCSFRIWGSGIVRTVVLTQPGFVLDWEMVTGYPAAAAVLLLCVRTSMKEGGQ